MSRGVVPIHSCTSGALFPDSADVDVGDDKDSNRSFGAFEYADGEF